MLVICPKCHANNTVVKKLVLIGKASPTVLFNGEEKVGYRRKDQLAVDEVQDNFLKQPPLQQFLDGFYCQKCHVGFVDDNVRKTV